MPSTTDAKPLLIRSPYPHCSRPWQPASLSADEVEVLALLLAIELTPSRQRLLAYVQDDDTMTRLSLGTVRRLFPPPHGGTLALARDGRLQRAQLVKVEGAGPWSMQVAAVAPSVTWAFVADTSLDPDLPIGLRMLPGSRLSRPSRPVVLVSGGDRESRVREAQRRLGDGPAIFCRPPDATQAWDAIVREATMGGLAVILEVGDRLPADGRERIERADHLGWAVTSPSDLPLHDMPDRPGSETTLDAGSVPDAAVVGAGQRGSDCRRMGAQDGQWRGQVPDVGGSPRSTSRLAGRAPSRRLLCLRSDRPECRVAARYLPGLLRVCREGADPQTVIAEAEA